MRRMVVLMVLLVTACGPGQLLGPTITPTPMAIPTPTAVPTPTATSTPTPADTSTPTNTPTPAPSSAEEISLQSLDMVTCWCWRCAATVQALGTEAAMTATSIRLDGP